MSRVGAPWGRGLRAFGGAAAGVLVTVLAAAGSGAFSAAGLGAAAAPHVSAAAAQRRQARLARQFSAGLPQHAQHTRGRLTAVRQAPVHYSRVNCAGP